MTTATVTEKACTGCEEVKPYTEYHRDAKARDGRISQCKTCALARVKAYRERVAAERVEPAPTDTKACTGCGEVLPLTDYHRNAGLRDGYGSRCKDCNRAQRRQGSFAVEVMAEHEIDLPKPCGACGLFLPLSSFGTDPRTPTRTASTCRDCRRVYREQNREHIAHTLREWYEANKDTDEFRAKARIYYEANKSQIIAGVRDWHKKKWATDPEYRERHRDRTRRAKIRRRKLLANAKSEPYLREDIFERDEWTCGICDEPIDRDLRAPDPKSASIDHVVPLSRGGDDTPANVRASHYGCNSARGARVEHGDRAVPK